MYFDVIYEFQAIVGQATSMIESHKAIVNLKPFRYAMIPAPVATHESVFTKPSVLLKLAHFIVDIQVYPLTVIVFIFYVFREKMVSGSVNVRNLFCWLLKNAIAIFCLVLMFDKAAQLRLESIFAIYSNSLQKNQMQNFEMMVRL